MKNIESVGKQLLRAGTTWKGSV